MITPHSDQVILFDHASANRIYFTISPDGVLTLGKGITPNEAAEAIRDAFNRTACQSAPIEAGEGSIADLRAKFEAWCYNDTPESPNFNTGRNKLGDYEFAETDGAWHAWQYLARQSVAAPFDAALSKRQYQDWTALAHRAGFSSITAAMESLPSRAQQQGGAA